MNIRILGGAAFAVFGLRIGVSIAQTTYTVTEIGTLGGPSSSALAVSNTGTVVGISSTNSSPGVSRAFRWIDGTMLDLGTLGGPSAEAFDVNDAGQITGWAETADSIPFNKTIHAFRWENGAMLDLGTTGGQSSRGWAINTQGLVAGASQICWYDPKNPGGPCFPVGNEYAFVWDGSGASDLGGLFGSSDSSALGMNSSGEIVGQSIAINGFGTSRHAVLWENGQPLDLGTLGGVNSWAFDVNDAGVIAGFSDEPTNTAHHVFIYDIEDAQMVDLGVPPGFLSAEALAINSEGNIVGVAFNCCESSAFIYDGTAMHDLSQLIPADSGWLLLEATDINDAGWVVGRGMHNGAARGFLLKPVFRSCGPDIDCSGTVNIDDLFTLIAAWGDCPSPPAGCPADLDGDGDADIDDLFAILTAWGP